MFCAERTATLSRYHRLFVAKTTIRRCVNSLFARWSDCMLPETQTIEGLSLRTEPEAFYRTVLESLSEAVILIDADHRIFYANRLAVDITGYSPEELLGQVGYELLLPD